MWAAIAAINQLVLLCRQIPQRNLFLCQSNLPVVNSLSLFPLTLLRFRSRPAPSRELVNAVIQEEATHTTQAL
ncbi:hypothetical protein ACTXT7_014122 [Hymenolepis weldensis]